MRRSPRQFGPLYSHPSTTKAYADPVPAIHQIAAAEGSKHAALIEKQHAEGWDPYHTDTSWRLVPSWGAVLRAVDLPPVGGDTIWVDGNAAYESLPTRSRRGSTACTSPTTTAMR